MGALIPILILAAIPVAVVVGWRLQRRLKEQRRQELRNRPVSAKVVEILEQNVGIYHRLPDDLKRELHGHINVFLDEKKFRGCNGLVVTDEMCVTVAGLACMLLLNRPPSYFPGFSSILLYPDAFYSTEVDYDGDVETHSVTTRSGESWHRGPVILSWKDTLHGALNTGDGYNVVLHEFAHKLDEENDGTDGLPVLAKPEHYREWADVLAREYEALGERVEDRKNRVIDEYGLTSPPEFFAVATESFFEKPRAMQKHLPDLYTQLKNFYCVDPAAWARAEIASRQNAESEN